MATPCDSPRRLVIDTNAALDLLLFRDPRADGLRALLDAAQARWYALPAMRTELQHVIGRPALARYEPDCERILTEFDGRASMVAEVAVATSSTLRCRDADDQIYLDLALHLGPATIVTSDRDLLALARRAARLGIAIVRPAEACAAPLRLPVAQ